MKFCVGCAIALLAISALGTALPMANEDELVSLDSVEQVQTQELPHILKIAPRHSNTEEKEPSGVYDTIVEELRSAGVQTSELQPLPSLSYKELTRLLAIWHMTQGRNYYEASESRAQPIQDQQFDDKNNTKQ